MIETTGYNVYMESRAKVPNNLEETNALDELENKEDNELVP